MEDRSEEQSIESFLRRRSKDELIQIILDICKENKSLQTGIVSSVTQKTEKLEPSLTMEEVPKKNKEKLPFDMKK
jgi:predicted transcriptional regulator